jgi:hypothetical protein
MRWVIGLTFAAFIAILSCAWLAAERANPVFIDVDPAAEKHH